LELGVDIAPVGECVACAASAEFATKSIVAKQQLCMAFVSLAPMADTPLSQ
jgi:hypothetical protein